MNKSRLLYKGNFPEETVREIYLEVKKLDEGEYILTITNQNKVITKIHFIK